VESHPQVSELIWCQEEPKNMGAWSHLQPELLELFPRHRLTYVGRKAAASPACGSAKRHEVEQKNLVTEAVGS
jgi:multifunctional 2-oxoglutarate metabolism enzyme